MQHIEWNEIEWPSRPDFDEPQWLEIIGIRDYFNRGGRMCTEFTFESDCGYIVRKAFPLRPIHHLRTFLRRYMGLECGDIVRLGGYDALIGMSLYVFIDRTEGAYALYPALDPQFFGHRNAPLRAVSLINMILQAEDFSFLL